MKSTPLKWLLATSLVLLAISACTHDPIPKAIPVSTAVSYDHTQRDRINKLRYINQFQQAHIRTKNKNRQAQNPALSSERIAQIASFNPAAQQASFRKVAYRAVTNKPTSNKPANHLKSTWWQVHQGYQLGNFNHKSKVRRYVNSYSHMPKRMQTLSNRSSAYLPTIIAEVRRRKMPTEIALLPFVESAFNIRAYSPAHAAGLWQFIPGTARRYGLPVSKRYDARYNFKASTHAALSYLQDLNRQFKGDWLLSLAAYNCGEARVHREIAKNKKLGRPTDFWHLNLPRETRNYVPRLLAFKEVYGNPQAYGINIAYIPSNPKYGKVRYSAPSKYKKYKKSRKKSHRRIITHKVRRGDTLFRIAKKYRTSVRKIMRINGLRSTKIKRGKRLKIATIKRRHYG